MITPERLRNFIFGVGDSLVSTVGLISGIVAAGTTAPHVVLTGVVLVFVEAFSMAVGSVLSDNSVLEYNHNVEIPLTRSLEGGVVMFGSYFVSGFIPLAPYLVLHDIYLAFFYSIVVSLVALFAVGAVRAHVSGTHIVRNGLEMALIGGMAIAIGVGVGKVIGA